MLTHHSQSDTKLLPSSVYTYLFVNVYTPLMCCSLGSTLPILFLSSRLLYFGSYLLDAREGPATMKEKACEDIRNRHLAHVHSGVAMRWPKLLVSCRSGSSGVQSSRHVSCLVCYPCWGDGVLNRPIWGNFKSRLIAGRRHKNETPQRSDSSLLINHRRHTLARDQHYTHRLGR